MNLCCATGSSKQRASLRKSISSDKVKLKQCITNYNQIVDMCPDIGEHVTEEAVMSGNFPWSALIGKGRY